jgi:hypothetical protein
MDIPSNCEVNSEGTYRAERKKLKVEVDAELEPLWQRVYRVQEKSHQESTKHERYCRVFCVI